MFKAANEGIEKIAQQKQKVIKQLESLLAGCVNREKNSKIFFHQHQEFELKNMKSLMGI